MQKTIKMAIFLGLSCVSLAATTFANGLNHSLPKPTSLTSTLKLPSVTALRVGGLITVHLITSPAYRSATYVVEGRNQNWVAVGVMHHTLYLRRLNVVLSGKPSVVTVKIPQIRYLSVYGSAKVDGQNVQSEDLTIRANDYAKINLAGMMNIRKIIANDHSHINVSWVNSKNLTLYADDDSGITLAGITKNLDARLNNYAKLNATYLRTQNVLVSTRDEASAKVLPIQSLHAFAEDQSNIYYYKYPNTINLSTSEIGNVLQLGWHN